MYKELEVDRAGVLSAIIVELKPAYISLGMLVPNSRD